MLSNFPYAQMHALPEIDSAIRAYEEAHNLPPSVIQLSQAEGQQVSVSISFPVLYKVQNLHSDSDSDDSFSESDYQSKITAALDIAVNSAVVKKKNPATCFLPNSHATRVRDCMDLAVQVIELTLHFAANVNAQIIIKQLEQAAVTPASADLPYHARIARFTVGGLLKTKNNWGDSHLAVAKVDVIEPCFPNPVADAFNVLACPVSFIANSATCCCLGTDCLCRDPKTVGGNQLNKDKAPHERLILNESYFSFFCQTRVKLSGPGVLTKNENLDLWWNSGRNNAEFEGRQAIPAPTRQRMKL